MTEAMSYKRVMIEAMRDGGLVISVPLNGVNWEQITVVDEHSLEDQDGVLESTILRLLGVRGGRG